jgi:O-succinylbenzoic acid--CoA ligase
VVGVAAALASVGVVAPLSPTLTPAELEEALACLQPVVMVVEPATEIVAREAMRQLPGGTRPTLVSVGSGSLTPGAGRILRPLVVGDAPREAQIPGGAKLVVWTSGTTGASRAVVHAGAGVLRAAESQARRIDVQPGDHLPLTLPLSTVGGIMTVLRAARARGVIVPMPHFDAVEVVALVAAGWVQHLSLVPVMLRRVLDELDAAPGGAPAGATRPVRTVLVGGAPCPPSLTRRALAAGLPVALTWGMTESCAQAATADAAEVREDPATVGWPLEHLAVRVASTGRLALHLPDLAPAEVERARDGRLHLRPLTDREGWFVTGDVGEVDDDGRVRITGRMHDRIISGGVNVDPLEVERALEADPRVGEVAVVGIDDPTWGERVAALVVPVVVGAVSDGPLDPVVQRGLDARLRGVLSAAKRPRLWWQAPALPRTVSGKVDRAAIRTRLSARADPE